MIVRALIWLILGFLAYTVFQIIKQALLKPPAPPAEKTARGEDMVQDPECETFIPKNDAVKALINGESTYFCSTECRDKYKKK
jgi:YHS domain-containing protein